MILVKNPTTGEWIQVAGNGKAEYGASTVRSGTFVYSLTDNVPISKTIAFDSAMPDSDYLLEIDTGSSKVSCGNITKSASGFTCFLRNNDSAEVAGRTFSYTAFKLYTDTEYNSLLDLPEQIENEINPTLTATFTAASGIKSGGITIQRCKKIGDGLAVVTGYINNNTVLTVNNTQVDLGSIAITGHTGTGTNPTSLFLWSSGNTPQCASCVWKSTGSWIAVPWSDGDVTITEDAWFNAIIRYN